MPVMDKKQKKEKKREEKRRKVKLFEKNVNDITDKQRSFGKFQLIMVAILVVAISFFIFYQMN